MKKLILASATIALVLSTSVSALTLTFDETASLAPWSGGTLADGFSIPNLTTTAGAATDVCRISCGAAFSGTNAMYNFNSLEARLLRSSAFDLVGAYFMNDPRNTVDSSTFEVYGYDAIGNLLYQSVETITNTWTFITLNMNGISDFRFNPLNPDIQNMMMDDLLYNEVSAVPVPAAAWLFGSALLGFFGFSRRKANA